MTRDVEALWGQRGQKKVMHPRFRREDEGEILRKKEK
jgi:hypothetical protein